jgi:hypothetical protein
MKALRNIIAALMLAVSSTVMADNFAYLTIDQTGSETSFEISQISKITFDATNMIVHLTDGTQQQLPLASLTKMFFSDKGSQGIATISSDQGKIRVENGRLYLKLAEGEQAVVYNMKGEQVFATDRTASYELGGLQKGVYIVRVGDQVKKVTSK